MTEQLRPTLPWWRRLVVQLVVLVLAAMLLPLLALGISNIQTARSLALQQAQQTDLARAEAVADSITFHVNEAVAELTVLADSPPLRAGNWPAARHELERLQSQRPDLAVLSLTDDAGNEQVIVSVTDLVLPQTLGSRAQAPDFLTAIQGKTYLGDVYLVLGAGQRLLVAIPVFDDARQQVIGVLSAELALRDLLDAVGAVRVGQGGYAYVVDVRGRVIAHPDFSLVLAQADASAMPEVQDFLTGLEERQEAVFSSYNSLTNEPVFGVHARVESLGWGVVVEQPAAEILAPVQALIVRLSALLGLTVLLSAGLGLYVAYFLVRPISQLTEAARRLAAGDLSIRAPATRRNEVGMLATTFNQMAANIQQAQADLVASEERYRLLFDSGNDAMFVHGLTEEGMPGQFTEVNDIACRRLGYTREELLKLSPKDIDVPEKTSDVPGIMEELLIKKHILFETVHVTKTGRKIPVEINAHLFDLGGQPTVLSIARDITERKRAEESLRLYTQQLETMRAANLALTRTLDLDTVLETLLEYLIQLVPYDSANVMLRETEERMAVRAIRGYKGLTSPDQTRTITFDAQNNPIIHKILLNQESILIPDTYEHPGWERPPGAEHVACWMGVPLVAGGEVIGLYSVDKVERGFFTQEHLQLAEALAAQAAVAIQNARLFEAERKRRNEAETLRQVAGALSTSLEQEQVLGLILNQLAHVVDYDSASIQLVRGERLVVEAVGGTLDPDMVVGRAFIIAEDKLARLVLYGGQAVVLADVRQEPDWKDSPGTEMVRSWIAVPLMVRGKCIGLLTVDSHRVDHYRDADAGLVSAFANQAAVAIENARLFDEVKRHASELEQRVAERTAELRKMVNLMAGREVRMAELKDVIRQLRTQLEDAGLPPVADDPLAAWRNDTKSED